MSLEWREFEPIKGRNLQQWQRLLGIKASTGQVFLSASLTGDTEERVWAIASEYGIPVINLNDHFYVPADWMATAYPNTQFICDLIVRSV